MTLLLLPLPLDRPLLRLLQPPINLTPTLSLHNPLNNLHSRSRTARLDSQNFTFLVDDEHASLRAFGDFLEPDGLDEAGARVAEERVGEVLLRFEGGVGFGAVGAEAVDCQAGGGQRRVGVAE